MTIIFNGHQLNYEMESLCKLFFPAQAFTQLFNSNDDIIDDYIKTVVESNGNTTLLSVTISFNNGTYIRSDSQTISNSDFDVKQAYLNECERVLGIMLYRLLSKKLDIYPKWGILTGIRPVVRIHKMRSKGYTDQQIHDEFLSSWLVSKEKTDLAFMIASNQDVILNEITQKDFSLYVSIPFCPSRCSYCSFVSQAIHNKKAMALVSEYVDKLCEEIKVTADVATQLGLNLKSIYIGGGTPTAITADELKQVTDTISTYFDVPSVVEYTIEAGRADSITHDKLVVIKNSGATRISINPQTFNDSVLQAIGRHHTAKEVLDCYKMAVDMGFGDINMDFIAGLPNDTVKSFKETIDMAVSLNPTNITVHTLALKKSSTLYKEEAYTSLAQNQTEQMVLYAQEKLMQNGYEPYYMYRQKNTLHNLENIGYAKKGYYSYYNIYIMEEVMAILACGASAVSKIIDFENGKFHRSFNFKFHFEYIERFDQVLQRKLDFLQNK